MDLLSLPERPLAETLSVEELLNEAARGRLRLPLFQTGLRWKGQDVLDLFDSIVHGYPIGSLLLWERAAERERVTFGPVELDADPRDNARFIVDGQQRLTALIAALTRPDDRAVNDTHAVWVDLADATFHLPKSRGETPRSWIPLNILGDRHKLLRWSRGIDDEAVINQAFSIESLILKYRIPAYVVRDTEPAVLRQIFKRINASGVPLDEVQVFEALFGSDTDEKPIAAMAAHLHSETGFGLLRESWLLRCVKAVGNLSPRVSLSERSTIDPELLARTRTALLRAIQFLQTEAFFIHERLLPYRLPLIVLSRFFHLFPEPHPRSRALLCRWLWRGALSGVHGNSSHAAVSAHLDDLVDNDEDPSVQRLLKRTPRDLTLPDPMTRWYGGAATTQCFAIAMLSLLPQYVDDETEIDDDAIKDRLSRAPLGELFAPVEGLPETNPIAGHLLLLRRNGNAPRSLADAPSDLWQSLGLDEACATAFAQGDLESFLTRRAELLAQIMAHFVSRVAPADDGDRPPLRAIPSRAAGA